MQTTTKASTQKIWTIPNLLSMVRLSMIPLLIWLYVGKHEYQLTTLVLALSGLTDIVDGYIARRYDMVSDLGKFLDPFADKLTQLAMLACLVTRFPAMKLPLILLAVKEVISGAMGLWAARQSGVVLSSEWHGKVTTVLIYSTIAIHLLWVNIHPEVSGGLIVLCTLMMILSAALYFVRSVRLLGLRRGTGRKHT